MVYSSSKVKKDSKILVMYDEFSESGDDELDERLKVQAPPDHVNILPEEQENDTHKFRGRQSSYDVISNMWENFSVNDYAPYRREKKKKKRLGWSPTITIPQPFNMTVRDEKKAKVKSKRVLQYEQEKLKKQLQEEAELQKRVVPVPIPPSTFLPLYEELNEQREQRREYVKELSKEILKSSEKPFSFTKRETARKELKNSEKNLKPKKKKEKTIFKANPFPEKLFDLTLADKMAEEEEYRKIKIKLRAEEMLAESSLPGNMKKRVNSKHYPVGEKTKRVKEDLKRRRDKNCFKPQIHHDIPNFEELQRKFERELTQRKNLAATPTVCEPFDLHTARVAGRRSKFRESIKMKTSCDRPVSDGKHRPNSQQKKRQMQRSIESPDFRLTETARQRMERMRESLDQTKENDLKKAAEEREMQKKLLSLKKTVARKAMAHDPSRNRQSEDKEKMKNFRQSDYVRRKEYKKYLKNLEDKLRKRPLLFERESQTNAKLKAQRRYDEILREAGIEDNLYESILSSASQHVDEDTGSEHEASEEDYAKFSYDGSYIATKEGDRDRRNHFVDMVSNSSNETDENNDSYGTESAEESDAKSLCNEEHESLTDD